MGSQSLQVFLCFADITISLLLSRLLIVVCDAVANAAFVSGSLVSFSTLHLSTACIGRSHFKAKFRSTWTLHKGVCLPIWLRLLLAFMAVPFACCYSCVLRLPIQLRPSLAFTAAPFACLYGCDYCLPLWLRFRLPIQLRLSLAFKAATCACLDGCIQRLP